MRRTLRTILQWLVIILAITVFISRQLRPVPAPHYQPQDWGSWNGFYVISYRALAAGYSAAYPTAKRFAEHMQALRAAGYECVRPEDIARFLRGDRPLPDKALLILFDGGGRKDTFLRATPVLRQTSMMATLCVQTHLAEKGNVLYLNQSELKRISRYPHWTVASMGHLAGTEIVIDVQGNNGHFLANRIWKRGAIEDDAAFLNRITDDYRRAREILKKNGAQPVAYVFPFADTGAAAKQDPLVAAANAKAVRQFHEIAFAKAGTPYNEPNVDPYDLSYLPVPPEWTGGQLVAELEKYRRHCGPVRGWSDPTRLIGRGFSINHGSLHMRHGGLAWIRGTRNWSDVDISAALTPDAPPGLVLYARHSGPHSYLRLVLDTSSVRVQECISNSLQTIAWRPFSATNPPATNVRMRLKGNRLWVWSGNRMIAGPLPVSFHTKRGKIGIESLVTPLCVTSFSAEPLPDVIAIARRFDDIPAADRENLRAILLAWTFTGATPAVANEFVAAALSAAAEGIEVIPRVQLDPTTTPDQTRLDLAAAIQTALNQPELRMLVRRVALDDINTDAVVPLRRRHLPVVRIVSQKQAEELLTLRSVPEVDELLVIENTTAQSAAPVIAEWLKVCPPWRLAVETSDENLPSGLWRLVQYGATATPTP